MSLPGAFSGLLERVDAGGDLHDLVFERRQLLGDVLDLLGNVLSFQQSKYIRREHHRHHQDSQYVPLAVDRYGDRIRVPA